MNNVLHVGSLLGGSGSTNKIPWSALEYSGQVITAISGSAVGGQGDTSQCFPATASSLLQPSGDYAYNSSLSSLIAYSALSGSDNHITAISGSALGGIVPPTSQLVLDASTMSGVVDPLTQNFYIGVKSGVYALDSTLRALSAWATAQGWTGV